MTGTIRTKEKCPICGKGFTTIPKLGLLCLEHKTTPKKFYLDVYWKGRQRLFCTKSGAILDSYGRALEMQLQVTREIKEKTFDPSKYRRQEIEKFFCSNLIESFLDKKRANLAPSNMVNYAKLYSRASEFFRDQDVREIRKIDIVHYQEWLEKMGLGSKTVKNYLDALRAFLRWCMTDLEVLDRVPALPGIDVPDPAWRWIQREDQIQLLDFVPGEDLLIFKFLMLQGCRPGEARALKCGDVNLEAGIITIRRTFSKRVLREKRKGKKSKPYVIPIHPEILPDLAERVRSSLPEAFLFVTSWGSHYSENKVKRIWEGVRQAAGVEGLRLYDATRHSFASQLANDGAPLLNVSRLMGHTTTKTTERYYAHSSVEALRATVEKMSLKNVVDIATVTKPSPKVENWQKS